MFLSTPAPASDAARPMTAPNATSRIDCPATSCTTSFARAPSAIRTPNSLGWTAWFCSAGFASSALSAQRVGPAQYDTCARGGLQSPQGAIGIRFGEVAPLWFFDENPQARQCAHGTRDDLGE